MLKCYKWKGTPKSLDLENGGEDDDEPNEQDLQRRIWHTIALEAPISIR